MNFEIIDYRLVYKHNIVHMMFALYEDSIQQQQMSPEKIQKTLSVIPHHSQIGKILLFKHQDNLLGYALLIIGGMNTELISSISTNYLLNRTIVVLELGAPSSRT